MALYFDVYISASKSKPGYYNVEPNPAVLKREHSGIRFRNYTKATLKIDLSQVPGFKNFASLQVLANGVAVAEADAMAVKAGVWPYGLSVGDFRPETTYDASPRVILDV